MDAGRRKSVAQEARLLLDNHPVYLDTETTGLHLSAEVIEIGIVDDDGNELFDSLTRPRGKIDPAAGRVHGITELMLREAQPFEAVWPQAEAVLMGRLIGMYNVEFDRRVLRQSMSNTWLRWTLPETGFFDIMKLYARFYGEWDPIHRSFRYQSLELAGRQCGIHLPNAHRAVDDCLLTRAVLHYMADWS